MAGEAALFSRPSVAVGSPDWLELSLWQQKRKHRPSLPYGRYDGNEGDLAPDGCCGPRE